MRSVRRQPRWNALAACLAAAGLTGLLGTPTADASAAARPRISDCLGTEDGHDNPSWGMTNKEWAAAENDEAGHGRYATCRFVITRTSAYVESGQKAVSDTYSACDGPLWNIELKAYAGTSRSWAESRERSAYKSTTETHLRSVTDSISTSIAKVLTLALSGSRSHRETTEWGSARAGERVIKLGIPKGKRVYLQYAPWFQKSAGHLRMTYWKGGTGGRDKAVDLDLATHTPILKPDRSPRLDYQTRWLGCRS